MLGFSPKFDKNLKEGARLQAAFNKDMKELSKATKEQESKVNKITTALEANKEAIEDATDSETKSALIKEQAVLKGTLKTDQDQLKMMKTGEKEGAEIADAVIFNQMNESLFKISEAEMSKRQSFDKEMKAQEEVLEQLKKNSPEATEEIAREQKNLELKKEKETKRREKQQTSMFAKGFKGITNGFKDFGKSVMSSAGVGLKAIGFAAAFFALSQFLQSPMFGQLITFIQEKIIPAFSAMFDYFMKPGGIFDSLVVVFGAVLDIVGGLFDIITGIFTGDLALIGDGLMAVFGGLFDGITAIGGAIMGVVGDLISGVFNLIVGIFKGIFNLVVDAIAGVFNFINDMLGGFLDPIKNAFNQFIGGFVKIFKGDILGGLADIILAPFKAIGEMAANAFRFIIDKFAYLLNLLPGVNINVDDFLGGGKAKVVDSPEPPQFLKNLQGPNIADRAAELNGKQSSGTVVINQTTANNVSTTGDTVQQNSTRYVKDQGGVFTSNNA